MHATSSYITAGSNYTVTNSANVTHKAGSYIKLSPGFTASPNSAGSYLASLNICNPGTPKNVELIDEELLEVMESESAEFSADFVEDGIELNTFPNPFMGNFKISYSLMKESDVTLVLYDLFGKKIKTLVEGEVQQAGNRVIPVDAQELSPGIYFCKLIAGNREVQQKVICNR